MNHEEQPSQNLSDITFTGDNGIYKITWNELNITAEIDRIKETSDHEVKAEVKIISSRPTSSGHLGFGRLNLTSTPARNSFAKSLAERDSEVDWNGLIVHLCRLVLEEWRGGSPAMQLSGKVDVEAQVKWLIEPIIQLNNPTLIYGQGSAGKSWFAQYLAVLADEGSPQHNLGVTQSTVLYLDWETDEAELDTRITMIRRGLGLDGVSRVWYKSMSQGLANDIETIRNLCVEHKINLIIVDSLGSACMGEPESAEVVLRTFGALRSVGVSSLIIDHTNKEGHLFGSVYKRNSARQVFHCEKSQSEDDNKLVIGLFHKKVNNSKLIKPMGFELVFNDGMITFSRQDVRDTALEQHMTVKDRIYNILRKAPSTVAELAEQLYKPDGTQYREGHIAKELSENPTFISIGNHKWAIRSREEQETFSIE